MLLASESQSCFTKDGQFPGRSRLHIPSLIADVVDIDRATAQPQDAAVSADSVGSALRTPNMYRRAASRSLIAARAAEGVVSVVTCCNHCASFPAVVKLLGAAWESDRKLARGSHTHMPVSQRFGRTCEALCGKPRLSRHDVNTLCTGSGSYRLLMWNKCCRNATKLEPN